MLRQDEPGAHPGGTGWAGIGQVIPEDARPPAQTGWARSGAIAVRTRFLAISGLLLLTRTTVGVDGQRHRLPWGRVELPVTPGRHEVSVSFRYLRRDQGDATLVVDVPPGQVVELGYRAPWLPVTVPGMLTVLRVFPLGTDDAAVVGAPPTPAAAPGWYRAPGGTSDRSARRWWDGTRWTQAVFRPRGRAWKVWSAALSAAMTVAGVLIGTAVGQVVASGSDVRQSAAPLDPDADWVTVREIDGVRFDLPREPRRETLPIEGTDDEIDVHTVRVGGIRMAGYAAEFERLGRTDAQVLRDVAAGMAADSGGTLAQSRTVLVEGQPGLEVEVTGPGPGGDVMRARLVLVGDLLVAVETVFEEDQREVALAAHRRMARSIEFYDAAGAGEDAGDAAVLDGEWVLEWTLADLVAAGVSESDVYQYGMAGTFTWQLGNGRLWFTGDYPDGTRLECPGTFDVSADRLRLQLEEPCTTWEFSAAWELTGDGLVLSHARLDGQPNRPLAVWMTERPWTKASG